MLGRMEKGLRGFVKFRVEAPYPERVLNICAARNIEFWDVVWLDETTLSLAVRRGERRRFLAAVEPLGTVTVERAAGAPYFAARFRRRYALLAGLTAVAALLVVNSFFIRDFDVSGNETVRTEVILRALEKVGVRRGTFALSFRPKDICNRVLPEIPELAWLTVNVRGSCAYVSVRERVPKPEIVNERAPTNVVARRDALVTEVRALDGEAKVLPGTTVFKGRLLISGAVDTTATPNPTVPTRFLAGRGEVWGRTWYELSVELPLVTQAKAAVREKRYTFSVFLGEKELKFGAKGSSNIGVTCDKMITVKECVLPGGLRLPLRFEMQESTVYDTLEQTAVRQQLRAYGEELLREYLLTQLDGEIVSERYADAIVGDHLLVTLSAECLEQIGQTVPIPMEENPQADILR